MTKTVLPAPRLYLDLRCTCGSTLKGSVGGDFKGAMALRDIYLSFHREPGCAVTELSEQRTEAPEHG